MTLSQEQYIQHQQNLSTIITALRLFQQTYEGKDASTIYRDFPEEFRDHEGRRVDPLSTPDIDMLCNRLRTQGSL